MAGLGAILAGDAVAGTVRSSPPAPAHAGAQGPGGLPFEPARVRSDAAPRGTRAAARERAPDAFARPRQAEQSAGPPQQGPAALPVAAGDYHARTLQLLSANMGATLEYARLLSSVRSPADFVALSIKQASKHFALVMAHADAVGALSRAFTGLAPGHGPTAARPPRAQPQER